MENEPLVIKDRPSSMDFSEDGRSSILRKNEIDPEQDASSDLSPEKVERDKLDFSLVERFHEQALHQVGHGRMQLILFLVSGLVLAADLSELMALIMSVKSAQFEFCVDETQKSWLVGATLLGMGFGSIFWGSLGDRVGRRRALIYCLGVGSIFSGASVIMPTEGTFLTARLFSGIGLGGCFPLAPTYFAEFVQEKRRRLFVSLLFLFWPIGAGYVILISWFILPSTGFHLSEELKEHFSAWRRLLLAAAAPSLIGLVTLIFMPEAPLNLMLNGRDAESLEVYKKIQKSNRGSQTPFVLTEIEIPTAHLGTPLNSPKSVVGDLRKALESFWAYFLVLWTESRRRLTLTLSFIWLMTALGHGSLSSWVIAQQATLRDWKFDKNATMYENVQMNHSNISNNIINVRYRESFFEDVSIQNVMMNHVKFENCTFQHVNFTNVKASYVLFIHSDLTDCFFVDTDLGRSNFEDCSLQSITYAGLDPACPLIPDFSMNLTNDMIDSGLPVIGIFIGSILAVIFIGIFSLSRSKLCSVLLLLSALISIGLTIWKIDPIWALVGHCIVNILQAALWSILVSSVDKYPSWTRSGALGFCCAGGRIGSFFGVGLFGTTLRGQWVPIFSSIFFTLASFLAIRGQF